MSEDDWDSISWDNVVTQINEKQLQLLEERKLMEESELDLTKQLFDETFELLQKQNELCIKKNIQSIDNQHKYINNKHEKHIEKQKLDSKLLKDKKMELKRQQDIYGTSEADYYDETYGYIEDEYYS